DCSLLVLISYSPHQWEKAVIIVCMATIIRTSIRGYRINRTLLSRRASGQLEATKSRLARGASRWSQLHAKGAQRPAVNNKASIHTNNEVPISKSMDDSPVSKA